MTADPIISAIADMVADVGRQGFSASFLRALRAISGADMCSAFRIDAGGAVSVLFAEGAHPTIPGFAQIASRDYARDYWRRDAAARRALGAPRNGLQVLRLPASAITDPEYRKACYDRAGVAERLTIYQAGETGVFASGYRTVQHGPFEPQAVERLERHAPILISALCRHEALARQDADDDGRSQTVRRLLAQPAGLSAREAEICAGLIEGRTQGEIAAEADLSLGTVVTYRRRAYAKLGVPDRRALVTAYRSWPRP